MNTKNSKILEIARLVRVLEDEETSDDFKLIHLKLAVDHNTITTDEAVDLIVEYGIRKAE